MALSDHDFVNFSEDHELNYQLDKVDKDESQENRQALQKMADELKADLNKDRIQHGEFHQYIKKEKSRLS